jgi:hypothetical protein
MFANRFTALLDACVLYGPLKRNVLLSLAEADFYRVRWSASIMSEVVAAVARRLGDHGPDAALARAVRARDAMERAFPDAAVKGYDPLVPGLKLLLDDQNDAHVVAAAVKTRASIIVTDNLRHFPDKVLCPLDLQARSADDFIADSIDLDLGRAVEAIRRMRGRLANPAFTPEELLLRLEAGGLTGTVDLLRPHVGSL